jgi:hypothetical protein
MSSGASAAMRHLERKITKKSAVHVIFCCTFCVCAFALFLYVAQVKNERKLVCV